MATRNEKLNRLQVGSPCTASWDGMTGDAMRRHCAQCDRQVFDFARMTPRQIEARIEATGGRLCARITRASDGCLVTAPPPVFWMERRASPVATALVTAFLGLGGASAASAPSQARAASAPSELPPNPSDRALQPPDASDASNVARQDGIEVSAGQATPAIQAPAVEDFVTAGVIAMPSEEPLRRAFGDSDLVVAGIAGSTVGIDPDDPSEVETEVRVTSVLKGRYAGRSLFVDRAEDEGSPRLAPGTKVLAFLDPGDPRPGRKTVFVAAGWQHGLDVLSDDELEAYADRLDALERISRRGGPTPADLAEWLVATVEEPLTRKEATGELKLALSSLDERAEEGEISLENAAAVVQAEVAQSLAEGKRFEGDEALQAAGAFVTEAEKERLTRALLATRGLTKGDFGLYEIVRPWAGDKAVEWLANRFRKAEPLDDDLGREVMGRLADELESDSLKALLEAGDAKSEAFFEAANASDETKDLSGEVSAMQKELRDRFREMLGK